MPILIDAGPETVTLDRTVVVGELPAFNAGDKTFTVESLDGWDDTATVDSVFVGNGGGPGVAASGEWLQTEGYLTLTGIILGTPQEQSLYRSMLLAGLPATDDVPLIVTGGSWDVDKQAFVRRFDKPTIARRRNYMRFTFPLIMTDPFKYGLVPVSATMGVWVGESWFGTYADQGGAIWTRAYGFDGTNWVRTFRQFVAEGAWPDSITLTSDGDVASQRLTVSLQGPLAAGDWWLINENTGARLWANTDITLGSELVFDCFNKTATLNGDSVDHLVYGDWLTLEPGGNTFRLLASAQSAGSATISALPAYL
jgi:hypothetical protein